MNNKNSQSKSFTFKGLTHLKCATTVHNLEINITSVSIGVDGNTVINTDISLCLNRPLFLSLQDYKSTVSVFEFKKYSG